MAKNKKKRWIKFRHRVVQTIAGFVLFPICKFKFGAKINYFRDKEKRQYIVIYNHQTGFDQFFVAMSFRKTLYYVATEDIFSKGFISKLIKFLVAPIPIKKQSNDLRAVLNCMQVVREGGSVCLAPEGNRTYSGKTSYMKPTVAQLVKKLKLPLAIYRIEGGYGVQPRWSDCTRKGKMHCGVSRVIEPEEYEKLTESELYELINRELFVDEANAASTFKSKKNAEYIERMLYICPFCGLSEFESSGKRFHCKKCGREFEYGNNKEITGIGFNSPYRFTGDWYDYQEEFINGFDSLSHTDSPIYSEKASVFEVIPYKDKVLLEQNSEIRLFGNRLLTQGGLSIDFETARGFTCVGRNKLNIYFGDKIYQIKGEKRFNALKYMQLYYRYKNLTEETENGKFLGI